MIINIPSINSTWRLLQDWTFQVNLASYYNVGGARYTCIIRKICPDPVIAPNMVNCSVVIPAGIVIQIDKIYTDLDKVIISIPKIVENAHLPKHNGARRITLYFNQFHPDAELIFL